ncbi:hypothetical protein LOAG_11928, partial [Loa loa]
MHIGSGRRLPPTPVLPNQILSLSQTAPTTANSSPRMIKLMNNSENPERQFNFQNTEL